jgi:predicted ATPase
LSVPISLRASLLARLDRLPAAREIAQIGAALGREFDFDLLAAVAPQGQAQAAAALHDLHRAELIFPRGTPPGTRWSFKHALIQEAAYETLLKTSRAELHARIAETIVTRFAALAQSEPETVARHYEGSGNARRAGDYWANAGRLALGRYAGAEAVQHFSRALDSPGASTDRSFRLDLEISLGEALVVVGRLSDAKARLPKLAAEARENADYSSMARTGIAIAVAELNSGSTQRSTIALLEEPSRDWRATHRCA